MSSNQKDSQQRQQPNPARSNNPRKPEEDVRNRGAQPGRQQSHQQSQEAGRPHGGDEPRK